MNIQRHFKIMGAFIIGFVIISGGLNVFMFKQSNLEFYQTFYKVVPSLWYLNAIGVFFGILYQNYSRFNRLNECFEFYFIESSVQKYKKILHVNKREILDEISLLYELLNSQVDKLNLCLSFQVKTI